MFVYAGKGHAARLRITGNVFARRGPHPDRRRPQPHMLGFVFAQRFFFAHSVPRKGDQKEERVQAQLATINHRP